MWQNGYIPEIQDQSPKEPPTSAITRHLSECQRKPDILQSLDKIFNAPIFRSKCVTVARKEPRRTFLENLIRQNGGRIVKCLNTKTAFFVQSHSTEDDGDHLLRARRFNVKVVPGKFIQSCLTSSKLLDDKIFACGSQQWSALRKPLKSLLKLFSPPLDHWRSEEELPQCFDDFEENGERIRIEGADQARNAILVLPFTSSRGKETTPVKEDLLEQVMDYLRVFFRLEVRRLPARRVLLRGKSAVISGSRLKIGMSAGKLQALDLVEFLYEEVRPRHASALLVLGVIPEPIFDFDPGVFIYGRATGDGGCILSLSAGSPRDLLGTASHELMHCLGLDHCAFFGCVLNACCDDDDAEEGMPPLHLCPVDLRKLQTALAWPDSELRLRCDDLARFFANMTLHEEAAFSTKTKSFFK